MKKVTVSENQSWFDIAVQELGSVEGVFALMNPVTDAPDVNPAAGVVLTVDSGFVMVKNNVAYYALKGIKPATGASTGSATGVGEGIGYWAIGDNFIIQ